jgi:hypothetical protein
MASATDAAIGSTMPFHVGRVFSTQSARLHASLRAVADGDAVEPQVCRPQRLGDVALLGVRHGRVAAAGRHRTRDVVRGLPVDRAVAAAREHLLHLREHRLQPRGVPGEARHVGQTGREHAPQLLGVDPARTEHRLQHRREGIGLLVVPTLGQSALAVAHLHHARRVRAPWGRWSRPVEERGRPAVVPGNARGRPDVPTVCEEPPGANPAQAAFADGAARPVR